MHSAEKAPVIGLGTNLCPEGALRGARGALPQHTAQDPGFQHVRFLPSRQTAWGEEGSPWAQGQEKRPCASQGPCSIH